MGRESSRDPAMTWSPHDTAVWHTVQVVRAVHERRLDRLPRAMTPFRPHLAETEAVLAQGRVVLCTFRAVGDGSYVHDRGFFFATGGVGLAATAAYAVGQSSGNRRRRQQAAAMATPRWVADDDADLWVSTAGFYPQQPARSPRLAVGRRPDRVAHRSRRRACAGRVDDREG